MRLCGRLAICSSASSLEVAMWLEMLGSHHGGLGIGWMVSRSVGKSKDVWEWKTVQGSAVSFDIAL